jgi:hypothetical protein
MNPKNHHHNTRSDYERVNVQDSENGEEEDVLDGILYDDDSEEKQKDAAAVVNKMRKSRDGRSGNSIRNASAVLLQVVWWCTLFTVGGILGANLFASPSSLSSSHSSAASSSSSTTLLPRDFQAAQHKVAISNDGQTIAIVLPSQHQNAVYVFRNTTTISSSSSSSSFPSSTITKLQDQEGSLPPIHKKEESSSSSSSLPGWIRLTENIKSVDSLMMSLDGTQVVYLADQTLYGYHFQPNERYPTTSQYPFPNKNHRNDDNHRDDENTYPCWFAFEAVYPIVMNGQGVAVTTTSSATGSSSRLLTYQGHMVWGIYEMTDPPQNRIFVRRNVIPCTVLGTQDCCEPYCDHGDDDDYTIISYAWMIQQSKDQEEVVVVPNLIGIHMCTMSRCSVHVLEEVNVGVTTSSSSTTNNKVWKSVTNFSLTDIAWQGSMAFARDGKIVGVGMVYHNNHQVNNDDDDDDDDTVLLPQFKITTWIPEDNWDIRLEQTVTASTTPLPPKHYLEIPRENDDDGGGGSGVMVSTDGTVLCVIVTDAYVDRPVKIRHYATAFVFVWTNMEWKIHQVVDLTSGTSTDTSTDSTSTASVVQVHMSGDGQRLIIFQDDFSFRLHELF